jgi:predicted O-methyltransferase YrrM
VRAFPHLILYWLGLARGGTSCSPRQAECLRRHATGRKRLVEIGCWHGVTTRLLRECMAPDGVLHAVDPYLTGRLGFSCAWLMARREVSRSGNGAVRWLRMTDVDAAAHLAASGGVPVEFVFSDADNTKAGSRRAWEAWSGLVADRGIYILNTVVSTPTVPLEAVGSGQFFREVIARDPRFELLETVEHMAVLRRKAGAAAAPSTPDPA